MLLNGAPSAVLFALYQLRKNFLQHGPPFAKSLLHGSEKGFVTFRRHAASRVSRPTTLSNFHPMARPRTIEKLRIVERYLRLCHQCLKIVDDVEVASRLQVDVATFKKLRKDHELAWIHEDHIEPETPDVGALMVRGEQETFLFEKLLSATTEKVLKKVLAYRPREIIKLRYGIPDGYAYSTEQVAHIFGVSVERITRLEEKAIRKLQQSSKAQTLKEFL